MALVEIARVEYTILDPEGEVVATVHNRADAIDARRNYLDKEGITKTAERDLYKVVARYVYAGVENLDLGSE